MAHKLKTTPQRSREMSRVHVTGGKDEVIIRKILWHRGIRYRTNYKALPGKPDIAITKYKIAIFIDGEFWHGYNWDYYKSHIKRNRNYWIPKIEANMRHDKIVNCKLRDMGWLVLRFWSKPILKNPDYYADVIEWYVKGRTKESG